MNLPIKKIVLSLALLGLVSCGPSAGKLTDAQKQVIMDVSTSASRVDTTASAGSSKAPSGRFQLPGMFAFAAKTAASADTSTDANLQKMSDKLQKAFDKGDCTATSAGSTVTVAGAACPISLSITISSASSGSAKIVFVYSTSDADMKSYNDIDGINLTITSSTSSDAASNTISMVMGMDGKLTSQKYGDIGVSMNMNMTMSKATSASKSSLNGNGEMKITFSNFLVDVKSKIVNGVATYNLNGEDMTEAQLSQYFAGLNSKVSTSSSNP